MSGIEAPHNCCSQQNLSYVKASFPARSIGAGDKTRRIFPSDLRRGPATLRTNHANLWSMPQLVHNNRKYYHPYQSGSFNVYPFITPWIWNPPPSLNIPGHSTLSRRTNGTILAEKMVIRSLTIAESGVRHRYPPRVLHNYNLTQEQEPENSHWYMKGHLTLFLLNGNIK